MLFELNFKLLTQLNKNVIESRPLCGELTLMLRCSWLFFFHVWQQPEVKCSARIFIEFKLMEKTYFHVNVCVLHMNTKGWLNQTTLKI